MALSIRELAAQRLKKAQTGSYEKTDYSKIKFKPETDKEYQIRILPNKYSEYPIHELEVHKYDTFKKAPICLTSFGETDPIVKFTKSLWEEVNKAKASNDPNLATITKENGAIAKALRPNKRFFVQVIVRGDEAKGPLIWEFGTTVAQQLDGLLATEDYETMADIQDGVDLTIKGFEASMQNGGKYTDVTITPKRKSTPLSTDAETVEKWLEEQKNPAEILYKTMSYDELKQMLKEYLEPGDEDEDEAPVKKAAPLQPAKAPVKRAPEPIEEEDEEEDEEETPPPPPPAKKKPTVKKTVVLEPEEDEEEEDELSHIIPKGKSSTKTSAPTSNKKSWNDVFDEED